MLEFLATPPAQAVITVTVLASLLVVSYYAVRRFGDRTDDDQLTTNDCLTNFREMHLEGDISPVEYRNIKTVLGAKLKEQLTDDDGDND